MRRALLHAIPMMVLAATVVTSTAVAGEPELEGTYLARGVNADGSGYDALVEIVRYGDSFIVATMIPDTSGDEMQVTLASIGIGILNGGVLAVSDYGPDGARVASYRIEDRGRRLAGRWTWVDGDGKVYEETLTKLPDAPEPSKNGRPQTHLPRVAPSS
ncbi:MAG TPA: hypothetical protein VGF24_11970 [Vicinamibacterales bacterium]|jgi:hypothetical protein